MRICILTHTFPRFDGDKISSIFMKELAQGLVGAGNNVWVLTPFTPLFRKSNKDYKVVTYKYIFPGSFHKLGYSETLTNDMGLPFIMWLLSPFMYFFGFLALLKLIKKEHIEVVNAHWLLPNGFIASLASLFTKVAVVSTLPGSDVYMAKKNFLFNLLARFAARRCDWVTSNSPQLLSDLEKITKVDLKSKSSAIVYGIGSNKFKPDRLLGKKTKRLLGVPERSRLVLGVGRLVEKKGFRYLIESSYEIVKKYKNVFFVLIGDGDQRNKLMTLAEKLKVESYFKFLGNISYTEMNNYYNAADIFILPSIRDREGNLDDQSVAVMDAMSCAKAVVTTDFPGYRLVIKNAVDGFLVGEKDVKDITRTLLMLLRSPELCRKVGKNAQDSIRENFSWQTISKQYTELFSKIVSG